VNGIEPFPHISTGFLKDGTGKRGESVLAIMAMTYFHTAGIVINIESFTAMRAFKDIGGILGIRVFVTDIQKVSDCGFFYREHLIKL
jgi:hypothetical protein